MQIKVIKERVKGKKFLRFIKLLISPLIIILLSMAFPEGLQGSAAAQSLPGEEWSEIDTVTTNNLWDVTWGNGQYVAVGNNGTILTSSDGGTWSKQISGTSAHIYGVSWGNNQFVAVGYLSFDDALDHGHNWENYYGSTVLTSPDGVTWTRRNVHYGASTASYYDKFKPFNTSNPLSCVIWGDNKFVAVGGPVLATEVMWGTIVSSADGINWNEIDDLPHELHFHSISDVVWNGRIYVAVTESSNNIFTSTDGVNWTSSNLDMSYSFLNSIAWNGNQFTAVGKSILTSPEGTNWTEHSSGVDGHLYDIIWSGSQFVAVGSNGIIQSSSNGASWSEHTSGTASNLHGIAGNGSQFVAVGQSGTILISGGSVQDPDDGLPDTDPGDDDYAGRQPLLLAPWVGTKVLSQGNNDPFSHHRNRSSNPDLWHNHYAIDVVMQTGSPVLSATDGEVHNVNYKDSPGLYIVIKTDGPRGDEYRVTYRHLSKTFVKPGDPVKQGDVIASSGNSGHSTGPHLHFIIGKSRLSAISIPMDRLYMKREGESSFKYYDATKGELNSYHPGHIKRDKFVSSNIMRERATMTVTDRASRYGFSSGALIFDNLSFIKNYKPLTSHSTVMYQQSMPVSLRVYDTSGRVTGLVDGEVIEEIPGSMYNSSTQTVSFPPPYSNYRFEVHGNSHGDYDLQFTLCENGVFGYFEQQGLFNSPASISSYTIDWSIDDPEKPIILIESGDSSIETAVPKAPRNPYPAVQAHVSDLDLTLSWSGGGSSGFEQELLYDIYWGHGHDDTLELIDTIGPFNDNNEIITYDVGMLEEDTDYFWKVVSRNEYGFSVESPVWMFTTSDKAKHNLELAADPAQGGLVSGDGEFDDGDQAVISAEASQGYTFRNWTQGDVVISKNSEYMITVNSDFDLVANFIPVDSDPVSPQHIYFRDNNKRIIRADYAKAVEDLLEGNSALRNAISSALSEAIESFREVYVEDNNGNFIDYSRAIENGLLYDEAKKDGQTYQVEPVTADAELVIDPATGEPAIN